MKEEPQDEPQEPQDVIGDYHLLGVAAFMTVLSMLWQNGFFDHMC